MNAVQLPLLEEWRQVPGYEGYYEVSSQGRVMRIKYDQPGRTAPHAIRVAVHPKRGYRTVNLWLHNAGMTYLLHRLVAAAFLGPAPDGQVVRHLDGDVSNNTIENLAYGTYADNEADKVRHGRNPNLNKTHCPRNHEYTEDNTRIGKGGGRFCKACQTIAIRQRRAKRRLGTTLPVPVLDKGVTVST